MAAKSIVEIDVQDEKFQSFLEKFNEYQKVLGELPEQWRGAVHGLGEAAKETERVRDGTEGITKAFADGVAALASVNDGLDRLNGNLEKATKTQTEFNRKSGGARNFLNKASKDAKSLAGHIKDATTSLLSWGTVLGLFSGLAGAGGLWGLNHLAGNASAQRFTAMGLGTTAGGLNSTAVNFQKALGNPVGTLGAIRDAQLDLSKRWQFRAMGVDNPDRDPAELLPEMIKAARDIFVRNGSTQQGAEAYGLTNYFTLDDLNRFKKMSDEEIDAMAKQAQQDTRRLQLTDQQLRQWQDFNIQLDRSKVSIGNTFIRGLAPLAPVLGKLSDAFSDAIETVLKSPELGKWIDGLSDGIRRFGNYLASPEFQKDVDAFISGVERLGRVIGKVIGWIAGKTSLSVDDMKSGSSILSDKTVVDEKTGQSYIPGSESDPHVWGWMKSAKRASGVAPSGYDEYFEEAAKKYDLDPKLLKSVAAAESSWDKNAVSKAGAQGLMQVMPDNFQPGENPFDPRDNIMAGARVMSWAKSKAGDDVEEMLRWYNGGKNRGSKENREYAGRVNEQYRKIYGSDMPGTSTSNPVVQPVQQSSGKTDQILQQILDNQKRGHAQGLVVYNNTGGNAIVSSTQLGGFG
ncbi:transglycosylase SLT domain-containing protein [Salmonella enterica]|uniref:Lytic transglycosylase domain-containing protein n=1 Tax=Salmonella enterica TaxID=28901 RepID=A0A5Y6EZ28_SALER|nr:lytic transglycosylase domain-containing protein [Salmonella enterica]EBP3337771.1 lytic transglycosylase domain-containing protein [Salmonella enterica subsp. enterica]EGE4882356.1 transglycosylase SLT domain-containing protein [Salmonella enterica subsp. enterica serovar Gaminara]EAQ0897126.1 lytic transglycosylase domain-containing protein [Salmonella enterica]EAW0680740.1 lytic transglycosylase domain-containing protein [Salmonella enterica]